MTAKSTSKTAAATPWVPRGSLVELAYGRSLFVRDSGGPDATAPVVVLVHGWMATADLNFGFGYESLADHFRVVAFDQRGHGQGLQTGGRFDFARCADDVADVLDALGVERAVVAGYSMGGPVALNVALRHPDRTAGLVLCATAGAFNPSPLRRTLFASLNPLVDLARLVPDTGLRRAARRRFITRRANGPHAPWIAEQLAPSDVATIAQAGIALARFDAHDWVGRIEAPTASVVTIDDRLVSPAAQRSLARSVGAAATFEVTGGHTTCFDHPEVFTPVLVDACRSVAG